MLDLLQYIQLMFVIEQLLELDVQEYNKNELGLFVPQEDNMSVDWLLLLTIVILYHLSGNMSLSSGTINISQCHTLNICLKSTILCTYLGNDVTLLDRPEQRSRFFHCQKDNFEKVNTNVLK